MSRTKYILAAASAYFIWGFFSFGLKPISNYPPLKIMSFRLFVCVAVLSIISIIFRKHKIKKDLATFQSLSVKDKKNKVVGLVLGAIILLFNWLGFIYIVNEVNVQTAGLTYLICPILTTLLGFLLLKEKLSSEKWIAVAMSTIACILLSIGHFRELYLAVFVALAFALYLIIQRRLNIFDSFNLLNIQTAIIAIILIPFFIATNDTIPTDPKFYSYIALIVGLFTIIPMYLTNLALQGINSSTAGIFIYLNPIVNFLLALFYFKEDVSLIQYLAYAIICLAIIVFNYKLIFKKQLST